ncbi:MAG TPA: hypothetical protein VFR97_04995 [Capillimicrobium sp.]|nr:hypothetical protein [Capillimicrobium sp.]
MDDRAVTTAEEPETLFPPQSSTAKVVAAIENLISEPAPDPGMAALVLAATMAWPAMRARVEAIGDEQLDALLLSGVKLLLNLRSDDAATPETIDELYGLGAEEPTS